MSIISLLEISINSIEQYKLLIDRNKGKKYGSDLVSAYNVVGDNLEALSEEINYIFSDEVRYEEHFVNDEIQDYLSSALQKSFADYYSLLNKNSCEEKIILAYEWLFEIMLFSTDDEDLKSKITLTKNNLKLIENNNFIEEIDENSTIAKVLIKTENGSEELLLSIDEVIDDYIYCYLGDNEKEEDLLIIHKKFIHELK